jgi:putative transposase
VAAMEQIQEGYYYHIYNRGADKSNLFRLKQDFKVFLQKYFHYTFISVDTFAWCLMNNHFHFLVKIRLTQEQNAVFTKNRLQYPAVSFHGDQYENFKPHNASRQLGHLMNSYTKFFNSKYSRSGTLIEGAFKRKRIINKSNFAHLVCYIHRNPIHHGITNSYVTYPYTSYKWILRNFDRFINIDELMHEFGSLENFKAAHEEFILLLDDDYYLE